MLDVYDQGKSQCQYCSSFLLQMASSIGGVAAAKILLTAPTFQSGFEKFWEALRLDLSMEARILNPKCASLFANDELAEARNRLASVGYAVDNDVARGYVD